MPNPVPASGDIVPDPLRRTDRIDMVWIFVVSRAVTTGRTAPEKRAVNESARTALAIRALTDDCSSPPWPRLHRFSAP